MTLRQKRHQAALSTLERTIRQRDKCIAKLVRLEAKLKTLRRQVLRLERAPTPATAVPDAAPQSAAPRPVPPSTMVTPGPIPPEVGADGIPDFLRASKRDAEDVAAFKADQAARNKTKASVKGEVRKARQRGDTKRMPPTGRDAMRVIDQR